jgi:carbonic anhydrase
MKIPRPIARVVPLACVLALPWTGLAAASPKENAQDPAARLLRDAALMLLKEGNVRYVTGKPQHPHLDSERRTSTGTQGQEPFATVLACSDSREPVELIFDRGVGDLFVVRVAGNIAGESEMASVEYSVSHLNTPVLVVMGHSKCGAVTAVVKGAALPGHLPALAAKIRPAVEKAKADGSEAEEAITKAIQANVWQTIEDLIKDSQIVRERLHNGRLSIVGAVYDLEQGKVNWLGAHPAEDALVALADQAVTDTALAKKLANQEPVTTPRTTPGGSSAAVRRAPTAPAVANNENSPDQPATPAKEH